MAADSVFVVISGRLEVIVDDKVVRELGAGAVVGELALLTEGTRSASVRARRDSTLQEVSRDRLRVGPGPGRRRLPGPGPRARPSRCGLRGHRLGPPGYSRASWRSSGCTAAPRSRLSPTVCSDASHATCAAEQLADPRPEALERAEAALDRVILVAAADDPSRDSCLRQADQVVLVAAADAEVPPVPAAGPNPVTAGAGELSAPDLVLVGSRPDAQALGRWCDALEPWQVTIVPDAPTAADLRALGGRIAGRSVGIVLAGGGARAFAHVGVLQELADAGIHVDRVAGCSLGAIVAGFHAAGLDARAMEEVFYDEFVRRNPFNDYTIPTASLAKGKRTRRAITARLGGREIRALPHQFRCNSVDLLARTMVAHRSGDLAEAVAASVALPGLFPRSAAGIASSSTGACSTTCPSTCSPSETRARSSP